MLLITMNEWYGPGKNWHGGNQRPEAENKMVSFVTDGLLGAAIEAIHDYEIWFNKKYKMAINYTLLNVSNIEGMTLSQMDMCNVVHVDTLVREEDVAPN